VPDTAVSNTGPPRHLVEVDREQVLAGFDQVAMSEEVRAELVRAGVFDRVDHAVGGRLQVCEVDPTEVQPLLAALPQGLGVTDCTVVALSDRLRPDAVLTDDQSLRRVLEEQGYLVVGTVGLLLRGYRDDVYDRRGLVESMDRLLEMSTLHMSRPFRDYVRRLVQTL
jgi:predicted nucleic acid-binding protein